MPIHDFEILCLLSELENETHFAEALLFPEINRHAGKETRALENLQNSILDFLDRLPTVELHGRRAPCEVEVRTIEVELLPPKRDRYWCDPVPLTFHAVLWRRPGSHHAFVPALTIEVVGDSDDDVSELLPRNILSELRRRGATEKLGRLIWHQRVAGLRLERATVDLHVSTPRKRAEELSEEPSTPAVLKDVATNLNAIRLPRAYEVENEVKRLADLLVGKHGRSVLLVGPSGVGKTSIAHEMVSRRRRLHLASTPFWETTGARLMVGADSFGDWQERCRQVVAEASHTRAILLLGNLFELAEVARHSSTPQGMAGFFRPYIERGDLLAVVECTPQQRELLERDHPHLLQTFSVLEIETPAKQKVLSILLSAAGDDRVSLPAIETVERLHRRYASYSAYPGRPLRFLRELMAEVRGEIGPSDVASAFSQETGLPGFMVDDARALDLEKTDAFFSERIMGQPEAVRLVVDLLASVKAALSPPGRPIASLLFIGPTGVGKTEMARTLAQYLFQDRRRMVRFDMSEFADPLSVERLVGGQDGGQGLLTGKVREQPFGVVLFDELEKADPAFFDLLLQILGEGRLTDEQGRVADFTNSLIVMTSNLGATSFSKGPLGFRPGGESEDHARREFTSAVKQAFRPELFNRIDRLVPFAPLDPETATSVARRELKRLYTRGGLRDGRVSLHLGDGVAEFLAELGYDRRYGARPLKRAIENKLLEPLAGVVSESSDHDVKVDVSVKDAELVWDVKVEGTPRDKKTQRHYQVASGALAGRRRAQQISDSGQAHALRNRIHRLTRRKHREMKGDYSEKELATLLGRLSRREKLAERLSRALDSSLELETEAVLAYQGYVELEEDLSTRLDEQRDALAELTIDLYCSNFDTPDLATVVIYPEKGSELSRLLDGYFDFWDDLEIEVNPYRLSLGAREREEQKDGPILRLPYGEEVDDRALWCEPVERDRLAGGSPVGVAFELSGPRALPLMMGESGLHLFGASNPRSCEVVVWAVPLKRYPPPCDLHLRGNVIGHKRRLYNRAKGMVKDLHLDEHIPWKGKALGKILLGLIPAELERVASEACS